MNGGMTWDEALDEVRSREEAALLVDDYETASHWARMADHILLDADRPDLDEVTYFIDVEISEAQAKARIMKPKKTEALKVFELGDRIEADRVRQRAASDLARTRPFLKRLGEEV